MNEIKFKNIEIRNFLSIGNQPIKIQFNEGMNFCVGWNYQTQSSNGVGKTAIFFNAILYSLFGESSRNVKQNSLVNYVNRARMEVSMSIQKDNNDIFIYRSRKPNDFYYKVNGITHKSDNMTETQNQLNKLLDVSEDIFTNTFIINASDMIDFIKDEGSVKLKERFEKIFFKDVVFRKVLEYVRRELLNIEKGLNKNTNSMEENIKFGKQFKSLIEEMKKKKDFEAEIKKCQRQIKKFEGELLKINYTLRIDDKSEKIVKLELKRNETEKKIAKKHSKIAQFQQKIIESNNKLETISGIDRSCPLCRSKIDSKTKKELNKVYSEEVDKSKIEFDVLKEEKKILDEKLSKVKMFEKKLSGQMWDLQQTEKNKKLEIGNKIESIKSEIKHFQESYNSQLQLKHNLNNIKNKLRGLKRENVELVVEKNDLEVMSSLFDNTGGILSFFIEKVLVTLNQIISKFIDKMGLDFSFHFDEDLRLKFDVYDQLNLGNFSGGEQKAINFIVLFSLMEFFFNTIGFKPNFIIIDEIMDTTLASDKIEIILQILKDFHKTNKIGIYLLSHDYRGIQNGVIEFDSVIELAKKDGFTKIEKIDIKQ